MPTIEARQRSVPISAVGFLYAATINSLTNEKTKRAIYFHPRDNFHASTGGAGTIIDSRTAAILGLGVGSKLQISLFDPSSGKSHDLEVTIAKVVDSYPPWFLWVSADELAAEFTFHPTDPLLSDRTIKLIARQASKCY